MSKRKERHIPKKYNGGDGTIVFDKRLVKEGTCCMCGRHAVWMPTILQYDQVLMDANVCSIQHYITKEYRDRKLKDIVDVAK